MSKSTRSKLKNSRKRSGRRSSQEIKDFSFIDCPFAGAISFKKNKGCSLHVFDSIDFMGTDANQNCFEIKGLVFNEKRGWYEKNAVIPKYYGKKVYSACLDFAVDKAVRDNMYLGVAIFGKERPAKSALVLSQSEIVRRMNGRGFSAS